MKIKVIDAPSRGEEKKHPVTELGEHIENFSIEAKVEVLRELVTETNSKIELLLAKKKN